MTSPYAHLTAAQRDGRACIICGDEHNPMTPAGTVAGVQVFACTSHPENPAACPVPWCDSAHTGGAGHHFQASADLTGDTDPRVSAELLYCSDQPDGSSPYVRALYGPDWSPVDQLDVPLPAAAALADLLDLLPPACVPDLAAALRRLSAGPIEPRKTRWGGSAAPAAEQEPPAEQEPGGCPVWPWCRADHASEDTSHHAHVARGRIGAVAVNVGMIQDGEHPPMVRVDLVRDDGRHRGLELDGTEAASVADVLDIFDPDARDGFSHIANMVARAGDAADPGQPRETPWQEL